MHMEGERLLTIARQHNLLTVDDDASARLLIYASSAMEAVGLSSQSPFPPSVLSGWAEEELRALRSEKRPLLAHMTGEHGFYVYFHVPTMSAVSASSVTGTAPRR